MKVKKVLIFFGLLVWLVFSGTAGFMYFENWSLLDSLYMSIITLTTIGYSETKGLTEAGRIFNLVFIIGGLASFTFMFKSFITEITNIDFDQRRRDKMKTKISKLKNHTIICGYGRMGEIVCSQLAKQGVPFVVIEKREGLIAELKKSDYLFIEGDASGEDSIEEANVAEARVLVSAIDNDSDGLYIALAAKSLNPDLYIIVRATEKKAKKRMLRAGADKVILPFVMSGYKVAECVLNPAVEDLFDLTGMKEDTSDEQIQLADLFVTAKSNIVGKTLSEVGKSMSGLIVVGVRNPDSEFKFKPSKEYKFRVNDCIITLGAKKDYHTAKELFILSSEVQSHFWKSKRAA